MHIFLIWLISQVQMGTVTPQPCRRSVWCSLQKWSPVNLSHMCLPASQSGSCFSFRISAFINCLFSYFCLIPKGIYWFGNKTTADLSSPYTSLGLSFIEWAHENKQTSSAFEVCPVLGIWMKPSGAGLWLQGDSTHLGRTSGWRWAPGGSRLD